MITVTFPTRPTVATPPEPLSAVASRPHGQGFGGVFSLLHPESDAPGPGPVAQDAPAEMTGAPPDRPTADGAPDQDDDGRESTNANPGTPVQVDRPDRHRVATGESLADAPSEATVPVPATPVPPIPITLVITPVAVAMPVGEVDGPAGPEPVGPEVTAAALTAASAVPPVGGPPGLAATTRPPLAGAAEPTGPVARPPVIAAPTPPDMGDSGLPGPAPSVPLSPGPAPAAAVDGYEIIDGAGPILLAVDRLDKGRKSPLPTGVPAFWAAREAAEAGTPLAQDPASLPPAPALKNVTPQTPAGRTHAESVALLPLLEDASLHREPAASPGPAFPQTTTAGPAPGTPHAPTLPAPVPAGPATALSPQVPAQIAAAIAARPERPLELRLSPVELGGMTLNLRQDGDILRVVLQADRPDTLDLLRRNGDILLEELRLAGFSDADLSFADDGGARDRPEPAQPRPAPQADALRAPPAPQSATTLAPAQGLDLRL